MKTLTSALALMIALTPAAMADAPPATDSLQALYGCDPASFTPVKNADGAILYWNNPTCIPVGGPSDLEAAAEAAAATPAPVVTPTPVSEAPAATPIKTMPKPTGKNL